VPLAGVGHVELAGAERLLRAALREPAPAALDQHDIVIGMVMRVVAVDDAASLVQLEPGKSGRPDHVKAIAARPLHGREGDRGWAAHAVSLMGSPLRLSTAIFSKTAARAVPSLGT
jgi:hypothetical protein